ncbi:MAG: hypothetical protein C5B48_05510 [Candidatus Rokuibacteriota bacterium]|nr:MAG: hypothetical protein C5B48_05510 [Candidatus Rokubacteria bacterium]
MKRFPWELLALPALGLARLLPESGGGLYLRLAAATACLLLPGALVSRALGRPSVSAASAWTLAGLFVASVVMFSVHGSLWLALALYGTVGLVALPFAFRAGARAPVAGRWLLAVSGVGALLGIALWHVAGAVHGDALFHLARVRKLGAFGHLHLRTVDEFRDGGLHPGYALPLWHVLLALVARLAAVDPGRVLLHESSVLLPLAFAVAFEAGFAVFRRVWGAAALVAAQCALVGLAPGYGGSYTSLGLPATAARQLLVPAALALFFWFVRDPSAGGALSIAAVGLGLAVVHPTYALFLAISLFGYVVARLMLARAEAGRGLAGLGALGLPALAYSIWLLPVVRETASHDPSQSERARSIRHYAGQLDVSSLHHFRLAPEVLTRAGAVAVGALLCVPLAGLASRRRWAALVLGGSLVVLVLLLTPSLFTRFSDAVSLSQARRLAGFLPIGVALVGGAAVLSGILRGAVLPLALAAGIGFQLAWPGNFGYVFHGGGLALAAWVGVIGGAVALIAAASLRRPTERDDLGLRTAAATALFVLPVAVHGFSHWSPAPSTRSPLTLGVVRELRTLPKGSVVFSDDDTSYWVSAAAPLYVAAALPGHVADTKANRPYARRRDAQRFFRTGDVAIPRRYHADFVLLRRLRYRISPRLPRIYADPRFELYRL